MRKKSDSAIVNVWNRELGQLSNRNFAHRFAASKDLVLQLDILRKLDEQQGLVNIISFNAAGDVLLSDSKDRRIILWDWETGHKRLSFHSGHHNNVYQAKIMPYTNDRCIVTCGTDGVRHAQILDCGKVNTKLLAKHQGEVYNLAVEPGSAHSFYTCGADGAVQHIDLRTGTDTCIFTCKRLQMSYISLNAIAIDPGNPNFIAVGGSDQFARLYDVRRCKWDGSHINLFCPRRLIDNFHGRITGLAFSDQSELLVSYSYELTYLFARDIGLDPGRTSTTQVFGGSAVGATTPNVYSRLFSSYVYAKIKDAHQGYKGHMNCWTGGGNINFLGPKCEYVVSGSDCGRIFIWKKNGGELIHVIKADMLSVNCTGCHPHATVLASSGIEGNIKIWTPKAIDRATLSRRSQNQKDDFIISSSHSHSDWFSSEGDQDEDGNNGDNNEENEDNDEGNQDEDGDDDNEENEDNDEGDQDEDGDDNDSNEENQDNDDGDTPTDDCQGERLLDEDRLEEDCEEDDSGDFMYLRDSYYDDDTDDDSEDSIYLRDSDDDDGINDDISRNFFDCTDSDDCDSDDCYGERFLNEDQEEESEEDDIVDLVHLGESDNDEGMDDDSSKKFP